MLGTSQVLVLRRAYQFIFNGSLLLKQEEMMNEEQRADPFTRRKTLPQLVSMVRFMLTERKANFIKIATTLEKKNPCH